MTVRICPDTFHAQFGDGPVFRIISYRVGLDDVQLLRWDGVELVFLHEDVEPLVFPRPEVPLHEIDRPTVRKLEFADGWFAAWPAWPSSKALDARLFPTWSEAYAFACRKAS